MSSCGVRGMRPLLGALLAALALQVQPSLGGPPPGPCVRGRRIALVNTPFFHSNHVLAWAAILQPWRACVTFFLHHSLLNERYIMNCRPFLDDMGLEYQTTEQLTNDTLPAIGTYDVAIFLGAEYSFEGVRMAIRRLSPRVVACLVHNPDKVHSGRFMALHPNTRLFASSPHVADYVEREHRVQRPTFILPSLHMSDSALGECLWLDKSVMLPGCLRGVSVQGFIVGTRRNYSRIFEHVKSGFATGSLLGNTAEVYILGSHQQMKSMKERKAWRQLASAPSASRILHIMNDVGQRRFYDSISRTYALLGLFAQDDYYVSRVSSSVHVSLMTGVPLAVSRRFLRSYTHFNDSTVLLWEDDEPLSTLYGRIMQMEVAEYLAMRRRILGLAAELNAAAADFVGRLYAEAARSLRLNSARGSRAG